jgi:hypothetical protein
VRASAELDGKILSWNFSSGSQNDAEYTYVSFRSVTPVTTGCSVQALSNSTHGCDRDSREYQFGKTHLNFGWLCFFRLDIASKEKSM